MSWQHRLPHGVRRVGQSRSGFELAVDIPLDEDGYLGRQCEGCGRIFRVVGADYEALADHATLTCPYCGHAADAAGFVTQEQERRAHAAMEAAAEQYAHYELAQVMRSFGRSSRPRSRSGFGIEIKTSAVRTPGRRSLPQIVEEEARRTISCEQCSRAYAVYGAAAFCPFCGPRGQAAFILEQIDSSRRTLSVEDNLPPDQRNELRDHGVLDAWAANALEDVISLLETFLRAAFIARVTDPDAVLKGRGNIFQRLDDVDAVFVDHAGLQPSALASPDVWDRLKAVASKRHVIGHRAGEVDDRYIATTGPTHIQAGQRLIISRGEAEAALNDLEELVRVWPTT